MLSPEKALHQGMRHTRPASQRPSSILVLGGGGTLGSKVLESLLGRRRFSQVQVAVTRPLTAALRGLDPVVVDPVTGPARPADTALVVFDRARHANGRELAFLQPVPEELPVLASLLRRAGTRQLLVLMPHSPAALPTALERGLANLDEHAVSSLGFEHLVFVRTAQAPWAKPGRPALQRLADGLLGLMRYMVAPQHQPVRAEKIAAFAAELAAHLIDSEPGTRVAPPELVWLASQRSDLEELATRWLQEGFIPEIHAPRQRM